MGLNDTIISIDVPAPVELATVVAGNVKARRLELDLTQEGLATRAGVKLPTYRKFERTGEISLTGLLRIAFALDCLDDFRHLFAPKKYATIAELLDRKRRNRKRGKIKDLSPV